VTESEQPSPPAVLSGQPAGYFVLLSQNEGRQSLDVRAIFARILRRWHMLLSAAVIGGGVAAAILWSLPNLYLGESLVVPVKQSGSASSMLRNQFGGLAALAGIDLGGGDRSQEAIARLTSKGLVRDFIEENQLLPVLFADKWDPASKKWKANVRAPTMEEAVIFFVKKVRTITEDGKTHVITVSVRWRSAEQAALWANGLVELANERMRSEAIRESEQSIEYLRSELRNTNMIELQQAIYRLIENQINNAMLANVQRAYAFRVIDPAVPARKKVAPQRLLMTALAAVFAAFVVAGFLFVRYAAAETRAARGVA
jgi:uncharacterized protein involved in exopolysaccharide biosynthesis